MITVKFFALTKQMFGTDKTDVDAAAIKTVRDLIISLKPQFPEIERTLRESKTMIAVNYEFAGPNTAIADGDEVAFIPPMSGGSGLVRMQRGDFSIDEEISRVKQSSRRIGGIALFLGTVRDFSNGRSVTKLEFEHYPEMAEKQLELLRDQTLKKFDIQEITIIHRFGTIEVGGNIVLIVAGAEHRQDAFDACHWCIDKLKETTPIWKKEIT